MKCNLKFKLIKHTIDQVLLGTIYFVISSGELFCQCWSSSIDIQDDYINSRKNFLDIICNVPLLECNFLYVTFGNRLRKKILSYNFPVKDLECISEVNWSQFAVWNDW